MSQLDIRLYGDPILREKSRPLQQTEVDEAFRALIADMAETMYGANGLGLAANQVGEARRFFVADVRQVTETPRRGKRVKDASRRQLLVFINPEIIEASVEDEALTEGCLSIPNEEADVFRPSRVLVRYRDLDWNEHEEWIDGTYARVFQHELDHLDGVLFVDRVPEPTRVEMAGALRRIKRARAAGATHAQLSMEGNDQQHAQP